MAKFERCQMLIVRLATSQYTKRLNWSENRRLLPWHKRGSSVLFKRRDRINLPNLNFSIQFIIFHQTEAVLGGGAKSRVMSRWNCSTNSELIGAAADARIFFPMNSNKIYKEINLSVFNIVTFLPMKYRLLLRQNSSEISKQKRLLVSLLLSLNTQVIRR